MKRFAGIIGGPFPFRLKHFQGTSFKKILNLGRYNLSHGVGYSPFPVYAKIEICGTCNLDCTMCRRTSLPDRDKFMSIEQFEYILDWLPNLVLWSPHGYNEPLTHPKFFEFVEIANKRKIPLVLVTNGTLLNPEKIERLKKFKPYEIRFSIDAVGKKYEEIRKGASWLDVFYNLMKTVKAFKKTKTQVRIYSTIWKDNIDQIEPLIGLAKMFDIPIDFADICWMNDYGVSTKENSIRESDKLSAQFYGQFFDVMKSKNSKVRIFGSQMVHRRCSSPWSSTIIDVNGDVFPCSDNLDHCMGNVFKEQFYEIFNSEKFSRFRLASITGDIEACRNCINWGPEI